MDIDKLNKSELTLGRRHGKNLSNIMFSEEDLSVSRK